MITKVVEVNSIEDYLVEPIIIIAIEILSKINCLNFQNTHQKIKANYKLNNLILSL